MECVKREEYVEHILNPICILKQYLGKPTEILLLINKIYFEAEIKKSLKPPQ
jgi:hypothetical protein